MDHKKLTYLFAFYTETVLLRLSTTFVILWNQ